MTTILIVSLSLFAAFAHQDTFEYPDASEGAPAWSAQTTAWEVKDKAMLHAGAERSFAVLEASPQGEQVSIEATMVVRSRQGSQWSTAGVAVRMDDGNYWHLSLVEAPADKQQAHTVELCEMLDGNWLASTNPSTRLTPKKNDGSGFKWEYGHAYRLRLVLGADGIEGQVAEPDGTVRASLAYAFDNKAVKQGQPCLDVGGFDCAFDDVSATVDKPLTPAAAAPNTIPPYPEKSGYKDIHVQPTGFFHTKNVDGRWWLVDPNGDAFYAVATDHVNYRVHGCEALGYAPYARNVEAKYGDEQHWGQATLQRLDEWGFNTLACNHSPSLRHQRFPHIEFLSIGADFASTDDVCPRTTWTGFPNVLSAKWARYCDKAARRLCAQHKDDPWLIGYFIDNELEWMGKSGRQWGLFEEAWKKPAGSQVKDKWLAFVRAEEKSIEAFERDWGVRVESFDALAAHVSPGAPLTENAKEIARRWARILAEEYFRVASEAILRHDPNHMVLGCRFAGQAPDIWDIAGKYSDIVTFNTYPRVDVDKGVSEWQIEQYTNWQNKTQRPMMVTEWSFPALDAGLPSMHGAGMRVDTQEQRAKCFTHFQEALFRLPFMVGSSYFMYVDEPAQGIAKTFPEDSNYGLVNVNDEPYKELTDAARALNAKVYALHCKGDLRPAPTPCLVKAFSEAPEPKDPPGEGKLTFAAGDLKLEGPLKGHAWRLSLGDAALGELYPVLHLESGTNQWVAPDTASVISVSETGAMTVIDMEFEKTPTAGSITKTDPKTCTPVVEEVPPTGYRCAWRFWVPRKGTGWVGSQCLWIENTDKTPWRLAEVYHYLMPALGGDPADDVPMPDIPNYYRSGRAWYDAKQALGVGCWYLSGKAFSCNFWKDKETGLPHPDLRERTDVVVDPQKRYDMPGAIAFFYGFKGENALATFGQTVQRLADEVTE